MSQNYIERSRVLKMNYNWGLARKKPRNAWKPLMARTRPQIMGPPVRPAPKRKTVSTQSTTTAWGKSQHSVLNTSSGPSVTATDSSLVESESRVVIAVTECRGTVRSEVGIACIDIAVPTLTLCQMADSQSYINTLTKINVLNPTEILVPATFLDNPNDRITKHIKAQFPQIKILPIPRKFFQKSHGMDLILQLCLPERKAVCVGLRYRYYALAAAAALFYHLQNSCYVFYTNETLNVDYQESEGHAIIDLSTADRLELVSCTRPRQATRYSTLFGVLNYCLTRIGARCLRTLILQPLYSTDIIESRSRCVTELLKNPENLELLQLTLPKINSIGQLLNITTISFARVDNCSTKQLNYLIFLNRLVDLIEPIERNLAVFKEQFFCDVRTTLQSENFANITELIRKTINANVQFSKTDNQTMQRCYAIKTGINDLLDLLRKAYSERLNDLTDYVHMLGEKYDMPLVLSNNNIKGFHIVWKLNKQQKRFMDSPTLSDEFIQVQRLAGSFTMKTLQLISISTRMDDIMIDVLRLSNMIIQQTITQLKQFIPFFYKLCEDVANLDMLQSLAEASRRGNYIKPKFGAYTEVIKARHPMLELLAQHEVIPNLISIDDRHNVQIITGPNGSGKSIYIRQILLLQIMAQIGCYIPAESAIFRPADRMFARVYLGDSLEYGASTFVYEMQEVKFMMTLLTKKSLFIMDEICRSTSVEEGQRLAAAVCEQFIISPAYLYVTTHFTSLTKLRDMYLNVVTWQMETLSSGEQPEDVALSYKYNLIPGVTQLKHYGVYLVKHIWPECLKSDVYSILRQMKHVPKELHVAPVDARVRLKYELESNILKLKLDNKLTEEALNRHVNLYLSELEKLGVSLMRPRKDHVVNNNYNVVDDHDDVSDSSSRRNYYGDNVVPENTISDSSSYRNLSNFLRQDSDNINKLVPEITITSLDRDLEVPNSSFGSKIPLTPPQSVLNQRSQSFEDFGVYATPPQTPMMEDTDMDVEYEYQMSVEEGSDQESSTNSYRNGNNRTFDSFGTEPTPPPPQTIQESSSSWCQRFGTESASQDTSSHSHRSLTSCQRFDSFGTEPQVAHETAMETETFDSNHRSSSNSNRNLNRYQRFDSFGTEPSPPQTQIERDIAMEIEAEQFENSDLEQALSQTPVKASEVAKESSNSTRWGAKYFDDGINDDDLNSLMDEFESCSEQASSYHTPIGEHIFPIVTTVEGPNNPDESEGSISYSPISSPKSGDNSKSDSLNLISNQNDIKMVIVDDISKSCSDEKPSSTSNQLNEPAKKKRFKRFEPPRKLTKKEIEVEFSKQDQVLVESSRSHPESNNELVQNIINRPSVQQAQQSIHVATALRTNVGVDVLPVDDKKKKFNFNRKLSSSSSSNVNMNLFSDDNSKRFDTYLVTKEQTGKRFNFKLKSVDSSSKQGQSDFNFQPTGKSREEGVAFSSFSGLKEADNSQNSLSCSMNDRSFAPQGYYAENKSEINNIVNKYLQPSQNVDSGFPRANSNYTSIFETCSFQEDLEL